MSQTENNFGATTPAGREFRTTHWSVVLEAGRVGSAGSVDAFEELCRSYWYPIYGFLRRKGHAPAEAQDLTQEFFAQLLTRNQLASAAPAKGRFRSYLLTLLKHLLVNEWEKSQAQKRGGRAEIISFDAVEAEERYSLEPVDGRSPDRLYERQWAEALIARVLARLDKEWRGRGPGLGDLRVYLTDQRGAVPFAETAARLGMSEVALKGVVHRLRQRYRQLFREEIARTVEDPTEVDAEIRHLLETLSS